MLRRLRFLILAFLVNKVFITIPCLIAVWQQPRLMGPHSLLRFLLIDNFSRWDSVWYEQIALHGYNFRISAFFPLYPATMRAVSALTHFTVVTSGAIIANICFLASLYVLYELFHIDYDEAATKRIIWMVALFPTSYYFSAVYTESIFMLFVALALLFMRRQVWWASGASGFFASLTRNMGVFLAVPYVLEATGVVRWRDLFSAFSRIRMRILWVMLMPVGLVVYMMYLRHLYHDPLAFSHAEELWHRSFHIPFVTIVAGVSDYMRYILHPDWRWKMFGYAFTNVVWVIGMLFVIVFTCRRLRVSYWVMLVYSFLVPLCNPDFVGRDYFMSIIRYSLVIPPLYIALYELFGKSRWRYLVLMGVSTLFLMVLVYLWTINAGFIA